MNEAVLRVLQRSPWAAALAHNYRFQSPGECVANSEGMQENILGTLHGQRQIEIAGNDIGEGLLQQLQRRLGLDKAPELDREYRHDPTVEDIVETVELHGPCVLNLARILPADQGGTQYAGHHAILVIGTFEAEGRRWAVALDGNDLQNNPVMEQVRAYADKYYAGNLDKITVSDLSAIQTQMERAGKPGDAGQLIYSLINLDSAVEKARQAYRAYMLDLAKTGGYSDLPPITFPNSICVPTNTTVKGESMPEAMKRDLARLVGSRSLESSSPLKVQAPAGEL